MSSCGRAVARPADFGSLMHVVRRLDDTGYLPEFVRVYPHYAVAVERARVGIIQGSRGYRGDIGHNQQQFQVGTAAIPSAASLRFFVNLIAQLLEELCPNRTYLACEDKCLAAIQYAISECLKIVRHNKRGPGSDTFNSPVNRQAHQLSNGTHLQNAITAGSISPTLAQILDAIPVPASCPPRYVTNSVNSSCAASRTKNLGKQVNNGSDSPPAAGEYSDGVGGFKIKDFPAHNQVQLTVDGMGGKKAKAIED